MESTKLRDFERITQERRGNLIKSENWNNNFNRVEEVINENNETIFNNFSNISSSTVPSPALNQLEQTEESTILEQLLLIVTLLVGKLDSTSFETLNAINISDVSFDSSTGVFTFTKNNGNKITFDTALEKVPASFTLVQDEESNKVYLKIVNVDGSSTQTDVTRLLNIYSFNDSDTIHNEVDGYDVLSNVKEGSLDWTHFKQEISEKFNQDVASTAAASTAAIEAAKQAVQSASEALSNASSAATSAENAAKIIEDADKYAIMSKSYAVGSTDSRPGEDTDNAKWYYEHTKAAVSGDGVSVFIQTDEPSVSNCIWIKPLDDNIETTDFLLELSDNPDGKYFAEINGQLKTIENAVDSDSELTDGNYRFQLTQ